MVRIFKSKRRWVELAFTILVLSLSISTYLVIKGKEEKTFNIRFQPPDRIFNEAINHYRLENLERAYSLFFNLYENPEYRETRTLYALYLGNIHYLQKDYSNAIEWYKKALSLNKQNIYALHNSALTYLREGDTTRAIKSVRMVLELNPFFMPSVLLSGNLFHSISRYDDAIEVYERGAEKDPLIAFNMANSCFNLGKREQGERLLEKVAAHPQVSRVLKGLSYFYLGLSRRAVDIEEAIQYFSHTLEVFTSSPVVRYNLALLYLSNARYTQAALLLESIGDEAHMQGPEKKNFNNMLGIALWKNGEYSKALKLFLRMYKNEKNTRTAYIIGDLYTRMGEYSSAIQYYREALNSRENSGALVNLVKLLIHIGDYKGAEEECTGFMKLSSENPVPYICQAEVYFTQGQSEKALESLASAVRLSEKDTENLYNCARLYQQNGFHNQALQILYRIINLKPSFYRAHESIAQIYFRNGHLKKANQVVSRVLSRVDDPDVYYRMSLFLALTGEDTQTEAIYLDLISDFPYKYAAYINLCLLFLKQGKYEQTIKMAEECLKRVQNIPAESLVKLYRTIGLAYFGQKKSVEAARAFEKASAMEKEAILSDDTVLK